MAAAAKEGRVESEGRMISDDRGLVGSVVCAEKVVIEIRSLAVGGRKVGHRGSLVASIELPKGLLVDHQRFEVELRGTREAHAIDLDAVALYPAPIAPQNVGVEEHVWT